jgi:hypothetical protein
VKTISYKKFKDKNSSQMQYPQHFQINNREGPFLKNNRNKDLKNRKYTPPNITIYLSFLKVDKIIKKMNNH